MSFTLTSILPDFFWRKTNDAHNPVGDIAPPPWGAIRLQSAVRLRRRLHAPASIRCKRSARAIWSVKAGCVVPQMAP
jgi:hypothetical protein